ncbi:MAG: histidine kinase [Sphingobacteriales bacterium]|nr:MAG: histidine kinase [Sphingobacteriales bacterium]
MSCFVENLFMKKELIKKYLRDLILIWAFINLTSVAFIFFAFPSGKISALRFSGLLETEHIMLLFSAYSVAFYHYYVRKLILRTGIARAYINLLLLVAAYYLVDNICQIIAVSFRKDQPVFAWGLNGTFSRWVIASLYALFYALLKGLVLLRVRKLETERQSLDASLQNLRAQIEPHFIFNTLNYVYALSLEEKAGKTSEAIEQLSNLFRYTLSDSRVKQIPVEKELEFLEQYIHLNQIRIQQDQTTIINSRITWDKKPASIAPLLIVNFIENAFKHGIRVGTNSNIDIAITVTDRHSELSSKNTLHHASQNNVERVGLDNTRKRLELLYPEKYELTVSEKDAEYKVILKIDLN